MLNEPQFPQWFIKRREKTLFFEVVFKILSFKTDYIIIILKVELRSTLDHQKCQVERSRDATTVLNLVKL